MIINDIIVSRQIHSLLRDLVCEDQHRRQIIVSFIFIQFIVILARYDLVCFLPVPIIHIGRKTILLQELSDCNRFPFHKSGKHYETAFGRICKTLIDFAEHYLVFIVLETLIFPQLWNQASRLFLFISLYID